MSSSKNASSKSKNDLAKQNDADRSKLKADNSLNLSSSNPQSNPPSRSRYNPTRSLVIILGVVAMLVGLIYVYPYFSVRFGKQNEVSNSIGQLAQAHVSLEDKVTKLAKQLQELQESKYAQISDSETVKALQDKIEELEQQQKQLSSQALGGLQQREQQLAITLKTLMTRVETLEKLAQARQQQIARIPEVMRIFAVLRDAIHSAKPFEEELLKVIPFLDPNDLHIQQKIKAFSRIAKEGVPSHDELEKDFKVVAKDLRRAAIPSDLPWYSRFIQRLRSLIIIRKDGTSLLGGSAMDEVLSEIKEQLARGDLEAVLVLSDRLPSADLKSYQSWRREIEVRQFADANLTLLESSALEYLLNKNLAEASQNSQDIQQEQ